MRPGQSHLQNKILLRLQTVPANSLAQLGRDLHVHRSSVSRAIHKLLNSGLVIKDGRSWRLSEKGEDEASRIQSLLPTKAVKVAASLNRIAEQGRLASNILTAIPNLDETVLIRQSIQPFMDLIGQVNSDITINPIQKAISSINLFADADKTAYALALDADLQPSTDVYKAVFDTVSKASSLALGMEGALNASSLVSDLFASSPIQSTLERIQATSLIPTFTEELAQKVSEGIFQPDDNAYVGLSAQLARDAISSIANSQIINASSIGLLSPLGESTSIIVKDLAEVGLEISKMIGDLGIIHSEILKPSGLISAETFHLFPDIAELARTFTGQFTDSIRLLPERFEKPDLDWNLIYPAQVTTTYFGSVRSTLFEYESPEEEIFSHSDAKTVWQEESLVEAAFQDIGPQFLAMWRGSWSVLRSNNPDRIRQSAHSARELLMQILFELAPDSVFSPEEINQYGHEGKPTRKMRIKKILSGSSNSTIEWINSTAKALEDTYNSLAAISHFRDGSPNTNEKQMTGLLHSLGGWLLFVQNTRM